MDSQLVQRARSDVQTTLSLVPHFATMSSADQFALYRQLVNARSDQLARQASTAGAPGTSQAMLLGGIGDAISGTVGGLLGGGGGGGVGGVGGAKRASDLIDDSRHANRRIDQLGDIASDFIDAVSFP